MAVIHAIRQIVYSSRPLKDNWRLVVTIADGKGEAAEIADRRRRDWQGRVSPDGKWVAYVSDREPEPGNEADIWVAELGGTGHLACCEHTARWLGESCRLGS
jgi:Tol biopolymer transport system component